MPRRLLILLVLLTAWPMAADEPAEAPAVTRAVVLDFTGLDGLGEGLADSIRLKLRRQDGWEVVDRITTRQLLAAMPGEPESPAAARTLMEATESVLAVWGEVLRDGETLTLTLHAFDARPGAATPQWTESASNATERWRSVITTQIVETITGRELWRPPEIGDEVEPDTFGEALNLGGDFEGALAGWQTPDNVGVFYQDGGADRGGVLRIRTDLERGPYLEYQEQLRLGEATADDPPEIATDTSYNSIGAYEGLHVRSMWIPATPGQRYWLVADVKGRAGDSAFPRIFVKGFLDVPQLADGLHATSLREMELTPEAFAQLSETERQQLIERDVAEHPERYRRECYRWYLACRNLSSDWTHFASPFPPRGGLPASVQWLRIDIFCYWPPGEYVFDNVFLYADPRRAEPLPEEAPRTPNVRTQPDE